MFMLLLTICFIEIVRYAVESYTLSTDPNSDEAWNMGNYVSKNTQTYTQIQLFNDL